MNQINGKCRVGIFGCGTIGSELATFIDSDECRQAEVVALYDLDQSKSLALGKKLSSSPNSVTHIGQLLSELDVSLIIEAAGPDGIQSHALSLIHI